MMDMPYRHVKRGRKWCPDCKTEYEGNYFTFAGKPRGKLDDEGRVIHPCDDCIEKWEEEIKKSGDINYEPTPRDKVQAQVPLDMEYPGEPIE